MSQLPTDNRTPVSAAVLEEVAALRFCVEVLRVREAGSRDAWLWSIKRRVAECTLRSLAGPDPPRRVWWRPWRWVSRSPRAMARVELSAKRQAQLLAEHPLLQIVSVPRAHGVPGASIWVRAERTRSPPWSSPSPNRTDPHWHQQSTSVSEGVDVISGLRPSSVRVPG